MLLIADTLLDQEDQLRDQENQAILNWLSPNIRFWIKQYDFFNRYQDETCDWILHDPVFKEWLSGTGSGVLWCPGMRKSPFRDMLTLDKPVLGKRSSRRASMIKI